jgi:hypothetical protein
VVAGEHLVRGCGAGGRAEGAARTYEAVLYSTRGSRFVRLLAGARQLLLYENLAVTDLSDYVVEEPALRCCCCPLRA